MPETPDEIIAVFADESCLGNGREGDNAGGYQHAGQVPRARPYDSDVRGQ